MTRPIPGTDAGPLPPPPDRIWPDMPLLMDLRDIARMLGVGWKSLINHREFQPNGGTGDLFADGRRKWWQATVRDHVAKIAAREINWVPRIQDKKPKVDAGSRRRVGEGHALGVATPEQSSEADQAG